MDLADAYSMRAQCFALQGDMPAAKQQIEAGNNNIPILHIDDM
jgi:hypothetical protein